MWVAHGSGEADEETADARGRIGLPTDDPAYTLRRVWLTKEEEEGYYYGFSNEGLWPLCHVVHARPLFRSEDWEQYRIVNAKFAEALLDEMDGKEAPMVLIQDYHFALLPACVKARGRTLGWPSSGTSRGPTPRRSASAPGSGRSSSGCWGPTS